MDFNNSERLAQRLRELVPGGSHTYAKGADQYPQPSPAILTHGLGSHVWDADGNEFIEYGMGLRAVALGHAYPSVVDAVRGSLDLGTNFTPPGADRARVRRAFLRPDPQRRDGEVHQGRLDRDERGAQARSRAHGPRHGRRSAPSTRSSPTTTGSSPPPRWTAGSPPASPIVTSRFTLQRRAVACARCSTPTRAGSPRCSSSPPAPSRPRTGSSRSYARCARRDGAVLVFDEMITGFR